MVTTTALMTDLERYGNCYLLIKLQVNKAKLPYEQVNKPYLPYEQVNKPYLLYEQVNKPYLPYEKSINHTFPTNK